MPLLNQIVALEKGAKSRTTRYVTDIYHTFKKPGLFAGLSRVYRPKDEDGELLPPEQTSVQRRAEADLTSAADKLTELFDIVATKEHGNLLAKADVVVDGKVLVKDAPVPLLLFLEKELVNWRTMLGSLPVLDPAEVWTLDDSVKLFRTDAVQSNRTKKIPRVLEKAAATERHPAQTEVYMEDVTIGYWSTTKFSGAVQRTRRDGLIERADKLIDAVKAAREEANSTEVEQKKGASALFTYLLS